MVVTWEDDHVVESLTSIDDVGFKMVVNVTLPRN